MKLRGNILLQYSVITFVLILVVSVALGKVLSKTVTEHLITTHIAFYPKVIQSMLKEKPDFYGFLASPPGTPPSRSVQDVFQDVLSFGPIFRVKVWDAKRTILWSDVGGAIGQTFLDNDELEGALKGSVRYEVAEPRKREHATEAAKETVLEIYIPIFVQGRVAGVFEIYEANQELHQAIEGSFAFVWMVVALAGALLYALQFSIFYRAYSKQKRTNEQLLHKEIIIQRALTRVEKAALDTILALSRAAEYRDEGTGSHIKRMSNYAAAVARRLGLGESVAQRILFAAPMHDVGKIGIPDEILLKPGPLNPEEWAIMKQHATIGGHILEGAATGQLRLAQIIALLHHEKWDGSGYPRGLKGRQIPRVGQVVAIGDVFDALTTKRPYKEAFSVEKSLAIIADSSGSHFDPEVVEAFMAVLDEILQIKDRYRDEGESKLYQKFLAPIRLNTA